MATFGFGMNGSTTTESAIYFPLLLGWEGGRRRKGEGERRRKDERKGKGDYIPELFHLSSQVWGKWPRALKAGRKSDK